MTACSRCGQPEIVDLERSLCLACVRRIKNIERKAFRDSIRPPKYKVEREAMRQRGILWHANAKPRKPVRTPEQRLVDEARLRTERDEHARRLAEPIVERILSGERVEDIAKSIGRSYNRVRQIVMRAGYSLMELRRLRRKLKEL